jgi:hypothetical protein
MTNEEFNLEVERAFNRSKRVLIKKGEEYTSDNDRLSQFRRAAAVLETTAPEALIGMAVKHFTSIIDMSHNPHSYSRKEWNDKLIDLRNYTFLLDALLTEIGVD